MPSLACFAYAFLIDSRLAAQASEPHSSAASRLLDLALAAKCCKRHWISDPPAYIPTWAATCPQNSNKVYTIAFTNITAGQSYFKHSKRLD
jgi:hypothetical protein